MSKYRSLIVNFIHNAISYALPVMLLQFVVQPTIAFRLGALQNGLFLTLMAYVYFLTSITSSILTQVKLLENDKYTENNIRGDFNVILKYFFIILIVVYSVLFYMHNKDFRVIDCFGYLIFATLFLLQNYMVVDYRLNLQFNKILISNLVMCIGYILGLGVFYFLINKWYIVFIFAYIFAFLYDYHNTICLKEPLCITPFFSHVFYKYITLAGASFLSYIVSYGDRILLYPLTDGKIVSVYTSAEIIGKILMLLSAPISTFFMAYLVRCNSIRLKPTLKEFFCFSIVLLFLYLMCLLISKPLLMFLYPLWANESYYYVPYTIALGILNLLTCVLNVILIRYCDPKVQIMINGSYIFVYSIFSFILLNIYGLLGYCFGNMVSLTYKFIFICYAIRKIKFTETSNK